MNSSTFRSRVTLMNPHLPLPPAPGSHAVAASLLSPSRARPGGLAHLTMLIVQQVRRHDSYPIGRASAPRRRAA